MYSIVLACLVVVLSSRQSCARDFIAADFDAATTCNGVSGDVYFNFADTCHDFLRCVYGTGYKFSCGPVLFWDNDRKTCDWTTSTCSESDQSGSNCGPLPPVENGFFEDKGDDTALLQCNLGYAVRTDVQGFTIACTDGQWESADTDRFCEYSCVGNVDVDLSTIECPDIGTYRYQLCDSCTEFVLCNHGVAYLQQCTLGLFFDGLDPHFCKATSSTCFLSMCGPLPFVENGLFEPRMDDVRFARLKCDSGYQPLISNFQILCKRGATAWDVDTDGLCISDMELQCPMVPEVENGGYELLGEDYSSAKLVCDEGYEPRSGFRNFKMYCEDQQWTDPDVSNLCEKGCIEHCNCKEAGDYPSCEGCDKYITCSNDVAYKKDCNAGLVWDNAAQQCRESSSCGKDPCGTPPDVDNGRFVPKQTNPTEAMLECNEGFIPTIKEFAITCDGTAWDEFPEDICSDGKTARGKEFVVAFFNNFNGKGILTVTIISTEDTTLTVSDTELSIFNNKEIELTANVPYTLSGIPEDFQLTTSKRKSKKVLFLEAKHDVTVYAFTRGIGSSDGALVFPVHVLGNEYIASAGPEKFAIAVVALEDGTDITITFPSGLTEVKSLNRGEMYYTQPNIGPPAGTRITSQYKPIAVFTGNECTKLPVSKAACDTLYEQLLPVTSLGSMYIAACFLPREVYRLEIVAINDDTEVTIGDGSTDPESATIQARKSITKDYFECKAVYVSSSKPVMVTQFAMGGYVDNRLDPVTNRVVGDPSMVYLPALTNFDNAYVMTSFGDNSLYETVYIIVKSDDRDGLRINGNPLPPTAYKTSINVPSVGRYDVLYVDKTAENDADMLSHVNNEPFGAVQYGAAPFKEYTLSLGINVGIEDEN